MIWRLNKQMLVVTLIISANSNSVTTNNPVSLSILTADSTVASVRYAQLEMPTSTVEIKRKASLEPVDTVWITSPVEGEMYQQLVIPGSHVKPGDVLARISANPINLNQDSLKQANDYKQEYQRLTKNMSTKQYSAAELIFQQSRIDAITQREKMVQENESTGNLVTNVEGLVYKIARPLNTSVNKGERVVAIAQNLEIQANLDESTLNLIEEAERVAYHIATPSKAIPVFAKNINKLKTEAEATIKFTTSQDNYAYLAERPDWTLTIKVTQHIQATNLRIPHESLHVSPENPNTWFVWIIDPEHQQLMQRSVKIGEVFADRTAITAGLIGTEKLVISAPPWARVGMKVSTIEQDRGAVHR